MADRIQSRPVIYNGKETDYWITDTGIVFGKRYNILRKRVSPNGYHQACLRIDGKYIYPYIHRLVYEAFVGKIPDGMQIDHKDGDKSNNRLSNLDLVTSQENKKRSWEKGQSYGHKTQLGSSSKSERLRDIYSDAEIRLLCGYLELPDFTILEISETLNIPIDVITGVLRGKFWPEISKDYKLGDRIKSRRKMYENRDKLITEMRESGMSAPEIGKRLNMTPDAVYRRYRIIRDKSHK